MNDQETFTQRLRRKCGSLTRLPSEGKSHGWKGKEGMDDYRVTWPRRLAAGYRYMLLAFLPNTRNGASLCRDGPVSCVVSEGKRPCGQWLFARDWARREATIQVRYQSRGFLYLIPGPVPTYKPGRAPRTVCSTVFT